MAKAAVIRPYVEKVLASILGTDEVKADDDGDYPVRAGNTTFFVRLVDAKTPSIHVFAPVLLEVKESTNVFRELNELNARVPFTRFYWVNQRVMTAYDLLAETLDREELENACNRIATSANGAAEELQKKIGGKPLFTPEKGKDEEATDV